MSYIQDLSSVFQKIREENHCRICDRFCHDPWANKVKKICQPCLITYEMRYKYDFLYRKEFSFDDYLDSIIIANQLSETYGDEEIW